MFLYIECPVFPYHPRREGLKGLSYYIRVPDLLPALSEFQLRALTS